MVNKKLGDDSNDLDLDSLDKDFDIDGFDIDDFDISGRDPSKNNKESKLSKIAKYVDVKSFGSGFISKLLPKEYETTIASINENIDVAKSLYDKTTSPLRDTLRRNNRTLREITPQVSRIFGKKIGDKYLEKVNENAPYTPYNSDDGGESEVKNALNGIFGEQQKIEDQYRKEDAAQQLIRDRREDLRFNRTFAVSKGIYDVNKRLLDYHEQIDYKYKMKSMELKVRTYVEMRKHHMLAAANMNDTAKFLKQLVHNSALPDIQKMRLSEQAKGMFRERLIGATQAIPGQMASNYLKSIAKNAGDGVNSGADLFFQILEGALESKETLGDDAGSSIASPMINKFLGGLLGGFVGKKSGLNNSKKLKNGLNKLTYLNNNAQKHLMKTLQSKGGILGAIGGLGTKNSLNLSVKRDTLATSTEPTVYDNASRKSLVEIIPGLLSRILKSTEGIRTGKEASMTVYDHNRNEFTSEDDLVGRTMNDFKNDSSLKNMQSKVDDILVKLIGKKRISGKARTAIKKEIYNRLMKGEMFSPEQLSKPNTYRESLDDKTAMEIKEVLSGYTDQKLFSKDFWTSDKNTDVLEMDKIYNEAMNSHPDLIQKVRMLDSVGQKDVVEKLGLIDDKGDVSLDKLIGFYSGEGKVKRNGQGKRFGGNFDHVQNGRFGNGSFNDSNDYANQRNSDIDDSSYNESNQILSDIRDAMASAQEVKNKILVVEEEIRNIVQGINDYLPEINSVSYNISGDELAEKFYSNIKKDVDGRFKRAGKSIRSGFGKVFNALGTPFRLAKSGILSLKDKLCDVYVKGKDGVALYASKLREGKYFDQATGKVIKKLSDIKGVVVDEFGNVVLTMEDIKNGLYDFRGKKIVTSFLGKLKGFGEWTTNKINMLNPLYHVGKTIGKIKNKVKDWWTDESMDVYVKGESSPRLLKIIFQNRGYFSKATGKALTGADKIDGEVVDKEGNVILSNEDIKKGLVDKYGKPIKFGIGKYLSKGVSLFNKLFIKPAKAAAKLAGKAVKGAFKGVAALGRFLFGTKFSEATADKALPEGASLEARYLNRIYFFLRATFGGAVNGLFNKVHQAGRGATSRFGNLFENIKSKFSRRKSAKQKARDKKREQMKQKMEDYSWKRWFMKVKKDRIKDEEGRKNSWRWKLKNRFKTTNKKQAKKAAMKKFGWLGFVLGGIASLGWFMFKKLTSSLFKVGKWITSGLGKLLKPLANGLLRGAGSLAMNAVKLGGRALGSVAMWAGRGLISAAPAILTNPVGLTIAAVALVAVAGYFAYKWWSGRLKPLQKYRYAQYGADLENKDVMEKIAAAEKYFYDHLSFSSVGKPPVMGSDFDAKYFANLCGCQLGDMNDQKTKWWCSWFDRRFVPVAIRWAMTMQEYLGSKPFYDADELLKDSQKVQFALKVGFDTADANCPYNLQGGPDPFVPTTVGNGAVLYQLNEIREKYFDDMPKSEQGEVKIKEAFQTSIKSDAKYDSIDTLKAKDKEDLKITMDVGNRSLLADKNNMNTVQLEEDVIRNQETSESANSFTWVRLLSYGLTPTQIKQASIVNKMLAFEQIAISEYVTFKSGKADILYPKGEGYHIAQGDFKLGTYFRGFFGWSEDFTHEDYKKYAPFIIRFFAVLGRYLALANAHCPGVNIFDVYKQKNDILCPIAKSLVNTNLGQGIVYSDRYTKYTVPLEAYKAGTRWNIWMVMGEIQPGIAMNTDFKTVQVYIDDLDPKNGKSTNAKSDSSKAGAAGKGNLNSDLRKKHGIGTGGGITFRDIQKNNADASTVELDKDGNPKKVGNPLPTAPKVNNKTTMSDILAGRVPGVTPKAPGEGSILPPWMSGNGDGSNIPPMLRNDGNEDSGDPTYDDAINAIKKGGYVDADIDTSNLQGNIPKAPEGQPVNPGQLSADGSYLPTDSNVVTSLYGMRDLHNGKGARMHNGIDLRAKHGDNIRAFRDGTIISGWGGTYGTIEIQHDDGLITKYLHTSPESAAYSKPGRRVKAGDIIGKAGGYGPKGNTSYNPHLHFETIEVKNKVRTNVNPLKYLLGSGFNIAEKLDSGAIARLDKVYRQENKGSPAYRNSRERVNEMLASTSPRAPKAKDVPKPTTDSKATTPDIKNTASTGGVTSSPLPSTGFVAGDNPLSSIMNGQKPNNNISETGDGGPNYLGDGSQLEGGDASIFASGDKRIDELRQANMRPREATLKDTNSILIDNMAINKAILQQITDMNNKVGQLVQTSSSVASIMVGGKQVELQQTPKTIDNSNAKDAPNKITRTATANPYVSFSKKAV